MQDMTLGPEVAEHCAKALTLLRRRESDPVDPAGIVGADAAAIVRLDEVRDAPMVILKGDLTSLLDMLRPDMLLIRVPSPGRETLS